ncbi:unnamed protein product, partial [Symbiodinium pilosum]
MACRLMLATLEDIRAALNVLALNFDLKDKVVEELLKVGVRNLEEFRFLFGLGDEAAVQTARLRRTWAAARVYFSQDRSKVALADLDSLLEESELRDAKQAFWQRYRLRFPAEVCGVWKVRSLQFQLGTFQKKRRLGDGLLTEEAETEESYTADCDTYLNKLHTLLIAYSLAGSQPIPGASDASKEQTLGLPANKCLAWLQARDAEERLEWVSKYRESTRPLRGGRGEDLVPDVSAPPAAAAPAPSAPKPTLESKFLPGPVINGKLTAKQMRDGLRLCEGFIKGSCSNK